ncbi:hypothetical protein TI05_01040 [Achromatium sp. WMS3]|nr:hypothetical protein TI05_01040 [Achromatium sp. WMS3]
MTTTHLIPVPEQTLIWQGTPSDHSGAYHIILAQSYDNKPIRLEIENPDEHRLEIPGLLDSGWDPDAAEVVPLFFANAKPHRPLEGVYVNTKQIASTTELQDAIGKFSAKYRAMFEPTFKSESINVNKTFIPAIIIYQQIEATETIRSYTENTGSYGGKAVTTETLNKLKDDLLEIAELLDSGATGFVQIIIDTDDRDVNVGVATLADLITWWLWGDVKPTNIQVGDGW